MYWFPSFWIFSLGWSDTNGISTRGLGLCLCRSSEGFKENLDRLLLAEAFHMPELVRAAGNSLANAFHNYYPNEPFKFSAHPKILQVFPESLVRIIDLRKPNMEK